MSRPTLHLVEKYGMEKIGGAVYILGAMLQEGRPFYPPHGGICNNIGMHINDIHAAGKIVADVARLWPEYSGDPSYPVPGWCGYNSHVAFNMASPGMMWSQDHEYGQARWRLVQFMVDQLAHELVEYDKAPWPKYHNP